MSEFKDAVSEATPAMDSPATLRSRVSRAISTAQAALEEITTKVKSTSISESVESSTVFFQDAMKKAYAAIENVKETLQSKEFSASEIPLQALNQALERARVAVDEIKAVAMKYDEKYKVSSTISSRIGEARERAQKAIEDANVAVKKAQGDVAGILQKYGYSAWKESITKGIESSIKSALDGYKAADAKYNLTDRITAAGKRVSEVDKQYGVSDKVMELSEKAQKIGDEYSGNRVTPIVESGKKIIAEGINAVQTRIAAASTGGMDENKMDEDN